jgi:hypothetical protein
MAAPAAIKPGSVTPTDSKKGTSKVELTPPARPGPQATVKIAPASPAAAPAAAIKTAAPAEVSEAAPDSLTGILAIAATVVALAALGVQVWMFL